MLEVVRASKRFGEVTAVQSVSLSVREGVVFGLLGPNGAGKTTLLNLVTGLLEQDEGSVTVAGNDVRSKPLEAKRAIGFVPQDLAIYDDVSAWDNVAFFGRLYGLWGRRLSAAVSESLDFVGLADAAKRLPKTFSGGMKRRLNIACGIVHEPKLVLMDEPTVGIDPQSRTHILNSVEELNRRGCTVVYTSHYMEEVERICSHIAILDHGKIIAEGSLYELRTLIHDATTYVLTMKEPVQVDANELAGIDGVRSADVRDYTVTVTSELDAYNIDKVVGYFAERGIPLRGVTMDEPSLETVFLHLTGRTLRDGEGT